jgi:hypothetical protein
MPTPKKPANNKPFPAFLKPKPIKVITRKVLEGIADGIHNPATGHYLNLCSGTLQNGPDPVCEKRPMHCGLGELYFVVTGKQPEEAKVGESDVVDTVTERSTIGDYAKLHEKNIAMARKKIKAFGLPLDLTVNLLDQIENHDFECEKEGEFRALLDDIPSENDQGEDITKDFKVRAKRVAATLRKAAALLPR